jgi:hypothetical protein
VLLVDRADGQVGEVGEEALAAVGLEVLERALGQVGLLLGQPPSPDASELSIGSRWLSVQEPVACSARRSARAISPPRRDGPIRLLQVDAPADALFGDVGVHARVSGVGRQLVLDRSTRARRRVSSPANLAAVASRASALAS